MLTKACSGSIGRPAGWRMEFGGEVRGTKEAEASCERWRRSSRYSTVQDDETEKSDLYERRTE